MHNFLFGIYPYIALSVLILGSIARYERDPFTWKSSSSQFLRRKQLVMGSVLFHVGILVIFPELATFLPDNMRPGPG